MQAAAPTGAAHMHTPTHWCLAVRCTLHACVMVPRGGRMTACAHINTHKAYLCGCEDGSADPGVLHLGHCRRGIQLLCQRWAVL